MKTKRSKRRRKPTYGAAGRIARIVLELLSRPQGWSYAAIQDELGISERTLHRYVNVLRSELVDRNERPLFDVVRRGGQRFLCFARPQDYPDAGVYQVVSLYFTLSVLGFLEGTVLKEGVEGIWSRLERALPAKQRARIANAQRKFFAVPYTPKDYRRFDDELDLILRCLIDQYRMRIDYQGLLGEGKTHNFDPYTLVMYRDGLYLLGYSHLYRRVISLAVERIRKAEKLNDRFDYPARYSPHKYTDRVFGIIEGPETYVELLLLNPQTAAFLRSRRIHPTQQFRQRRDGTTVLSMTVRGTTELANWILGMTPWVKVLRPARLRREVAGRLSKAVKLYNKCGPSLRNLVRRPG